MRGSPTPERPNTQDLQGIGDAPPSLQGRQLSVLGESPGNSIRSFPQAEYDGSEAFRALVRPELAELLKLLHLDVTFVRGSGCHLWTGDSEDPVLDLVGGYGTLLFGHNHPDLVRAATDYLAAGRPIHVQGSIKPATGLLAERLSRGRYHVLFANSGAEAVEIAIKHALLERRGPLVALEGAFHGKTLGALQLTANPEYRDGFEIGMDILRVPRDDVAALRATVLERRPSAVFLELVQGEGGVVPLSREFVLAAREVCDATGAALIVDECQTGLGRTGTFLAADQYGITPDLVLLSKALGGGIVKISAVLIRNERYQRQLSFVHTSTFADDDFSASVALKVLDLLDADTLARCAESGRRLKERLSGLAAEFPDVIRDVRGLGLMLGIEFAPPTEGFMLKAAADDLGLIVTGYLFHNHRIRVAPTLSDPMTLRVQPPLVTPVKELDRFVSALRDVCIRIQSGDSLGLTRYFLPPDPPVLTRVPDGWVRACTIHPARGPKVGWLFHLIDADDVVSLEPAFSRLSLEERNQYLRHIERRLRPVLMSAIDVRTATDQIARFHAILLPITASRIRALLDAGETKWLRNLIERGIDVAGDLGCDVVSLGQYTSIAMANGLAASPRRMGLTSGNSYPVALAVESIESMVPDLSRKTVAVVGASGNVGSVASAVLAERCGELILIGRGSGGGFRRLKELGLSRARVTTDMADCRKADVVLVAVSTTISPVRSEHLKEGALVCDLSVPAGVDAADRPDVCVISGGIARFPHGEAHGFEGFPLGPGLAFGCMVEGIVLALEGIRDRSFAGRLTPAHVSKISPLCRKYGFVLASPKTQSVFGRLHANS